MNDAIVVQRPPIGSAASQLLLLFHGVGSKAQDLVPLAQALAAQSENAELRATFTPIAAALTRNESAIVGELAVVQGKPVDIGGYYMPDIQKLTAVMRPSATFNAALDAVKA